MSGGLPKLHVELDGIRHAIITHLQTHHQEIEAIIDETLKKIDVEALVREQIERELPQILREAIKESVGRNVNAAIIHNWQMREAMTDTITKVVTEKLKEAMSS